MALLAPASAMQAWPPCKPLLEVAPAEGPALMHGGSPSSTSTQEQACLSTLPRHTRVLIVGNQRTKRALLGLEGVVKRATGLGGWHWLVSAFRRLGCFIWGRCEDEQASQEGARDVQTRPS